MSYEIVEEKLKLLPEPMLADAVQYIEFLIYKASLQNSKETDSRLANRKAGVLEEPDFYMASDFDETPDCFGDYL